MYLIFFSFLRDIQPDRSSFMKKAIVCLDDDVIQMIIGFRFCSGCKNRDSLYMEILEFLQSGNSRIKLKLSLNDYCQC